MATLIAYVLCMGLAFLGGTLLTVGIKEILTNPNLDAPTVFVTLALGLILALAATLPLWVVWTSAVETSRPLFGMLITLCLMLPYGAGVVAMRFRN